MGQKRRMRPLKRWGEGMISCEYLSCHAIPYLVSLPVFFFVQETFHGLCGADVFLKIGSCVTRVLCTRSKPYLSPDVKIEREREWEREWEWEGTVHWIEDMLGTHRAKDGRNLPAQHIWAALGTIYVRHPCDALLFLGSSVSCSYLL